MNKRILTLCALASASFGLSGCIAAAVPILAGGALTRTATDGREANVTVEPGASVPVDASMPAPVESELAEAPANTAAAPATRMSDAEIANDRLIEPGAATSIEPSAPALAETELAQAPVQSSVASAARMSDVEIANDRLIEPGAASPIEASTPTPAETELAQAPASTAVAAAAPMSDAENANDRLIQPGAATPVEARASGPAETELAQAPANTAVSAAAPMSDTAIANDRLIQPGGQVSKPLAFASSPMLADFIRYAGEQAFVASESGMPQPSAVLSDPGALDGDRRQCRVSVNRPASVLIDIDPGAEPFDPETVGLASPDLALSLKVLRLEGVEIAWISSNSAARADVIRKALSDSGLDPQGEDQLLLLRYPGDRKQTRRKQLALETCLLAIAGDQRSDFDELYDFLNNPDAALELNRLMNNGWFLITPAPQSQTSPAAGPSSTREEQP